MTSSDGSTENGISAMGGVDVGAMTVCEVHVDDGESDSSKASPYDDVVSPWPWHPPWNRPDALCISGGSGLAPRFAPTLPAGPDPEPGDAPIDTLRRALTTELRDRKLRTDSLADVALGGRDLANLDATFRKDARSRRPGRDTTPPWVRRLVEFVDDAPVFRTGASGGGNAREQVCALERWVDTSVARAGATDEGTKEEGTHEEGEGIQKKYPHGSDAEATAEGALWIYRVAFDELTRQVSSQCRDRGALLAKVWDHFFSIVEMRAGLRYEGLVTEARERAHVTSRELEQSRAETDALNTRLQELDETLARTRTLRHRDQTTHDMTVLGMEVKARDAAATQKSLREDIAEHVAALRVSRELEHALRTAADAARVRIHDLEASVHNERVAKDTIARHLAAKTEEARCLSVEVARLNDVLTERDDSVKALTVALHASALSLDAETSRATTLTRELDDTTAALAETRAAADASAAAYTEQTERLQSCRVEAGTLRTRLEDAHAARRALDLDLHDARATIDAGVEREASLRCALDEGVEALKLGRVERAEDRSKFDDVVANLNASLDDAHDATRDSRGRVAALVSELAKVREVMHDLAGSVRTLGDLAEGVLPEDVEEKVQRKCTEKVQAPESAAESVESVAADVERGRALMRRVINRLDAHRKELGDAVRARDVARSRLYEAHDIIAAAERDVTGGKLTILRLEKDVETRDEAIVTRRHDIANLRRTCVKHVEDAKVAAAVLLGEETKVMELRSAVARHERDKKTHAATVDDLHACRAELDASTDTNGRLVIDVQRLETTREALEAGKHAAEGKIAQLTGRVNALQDDRIRLEDLNRHERLTHERLLTEERERLTANAERSVDNVTRSLRTCETRLGVVEEDLRRTKARASVTCRLKVGLLSLRCCTLARRLAASEVASVAERETHVRDMLAKEKATTELVREVRREQLEWAAETSEAVADVSALRADAALQLADISAMRHKTDGELREYHRRFATSRDASQQCDDARVARRVERARRQPRSDEDEKTKVLDLRFISRVVVETYLKRTQLVAGETGHARDITHGAPGLGVLGNDTVFDSLRRAAVETPYFTTALGVSDLSDGDAVDSGLDRVIASARYHARRGDAKCAVFCGFADCLDPQSEHADADRRFASQEAFHVFCSLLDCATRADVDFSAHTLAKWRDGCAMIRLAVAMDVVANVYNTDVPREIPVAAGTLIPRAEEFVSGGRVELGLDLDFFLASLMDEYAAGHAPVNPMSAPRRVDGTRYRKHVSLRR